MLENYHQHNKHWFSLESFQSDDPHLFKLQRLKRVTSYPFVKNFPNQSGIYTLSGGRQLGKSTCFKQVMLQLIQNQVPPQNIFYLACDTLVDRHDLYEVVKYFLENHLNGRGYLFIDEVTFVKDWDLTIKAVADEGLLDDVVCCLSGSDKIFLQDAIYRLPGRRGMADQLDFELHPLSFVQMLDLFSETEKEKSPLEDWFDRYLQTGGYLAAINDLELHGEIQLGTYRVYQQWVIGDFLRLNKNQKNLFQVLYALFVSYASQVSYQTLSEHTEGLTKDTVNDYCSILERLGVISIQHALDQNKLRAAPKKNKKIHFLDPFIARALHQVICKEYQLLPELDESLLVESVCYAYFLMKYPTYYIKADGEVDIAYVKNGEFFPVEIKWRNQIRGKDIKQLKKYNNGMILNKQTGQTLIEGVNAFSLVDFLLTDSV